MHLFVAFLMIFVLSAGTCIGENPALAVMHTESTSVGSVSISPESGVAGEFGTWTVTYRVGSSGIQAGGGIRVQLPDAWHSGPRNSANSLQATEPGRDHYVHAVVSRDNVTVETIVEEQRDNVLVKHAKRSLDGRYERYTFVVRVVANGSLKEGDTISVVYGDRNGGSRGYRASVIAAKDLPVLVALDAKGTGQFRLHTQPAAITSEPGRAVEMLVHAPSDARTGSSSRMLISIVDKEYNPINDAVEIKLSVRSGAADIPETVRMQPGRGYVEFEVTPKSDGILRLTATVAELGLEARSNPCRVASELPERRLLWGDLHSHGEFSWDGVGKESFDYARYVSGLDFYTLTDHCMQPLEDAKRGLCDAYWEEYTALTDQYHDPPRFVTLHAYECSFGTPFGHHNVFFRDRPDRFLNPQSTTLPKLWLSLQKGNALTIPHHTGKFPKGVLFSTHDADLRRNFEIYSGHGQSEAYNPDHPLAFEKSLFTSDSKSLQEPGNAQDVWAMGLVLSTVAASDDHRGQPGKPHYGITALRAPTLSRDSVFQSLYDRHTYGTSGAKIILEFSIDGVPMGQDVTVDSQPSIAVGAHGTDDIATVDLLRCLPGEKQFTVIKTWQPNAEDFSAEHVDREYKSKAIYYVRLMQKNLIRGKAVAAWSSPIWTR